MSKASKLVLVLFMGLLFTGKAHAQEVNHAPTIEQCRADQRLWLNKLQNTETLPEDWRTLTDWSNEMHECTSVDRENVGLYYSVRGGIASERVVRLLKFLNRHGLYQVFIEEDKAGKR